MQHNQKSELTDSVAVETSTFNQRTSPNQEIRSPASADAAKTSKAQASKDPISQSLSDSSPTNNVPGPDRRSVPVLAGEVSTSSVKPGAVPPIKETNPESSRQNADRGGQP